MGQYGAAAAGAAASIYGMATSKTTKGKMGAAGGGLMSVGAMLPPPAGPVVMAAGAALTVASMIMGDPVKQYQQKVADTLKYNQFMAPVAVNASMSTGGGYSDMDRYGDVRDSGLSPFPNVSQGYFDYKNNTVVPGRTNSQFGGQNATPQMVVNISAMDTKSIVDRHADIGDALAVALQRGSSPALAETLSGRV